MRFNYSGASIRHGAASASVRLARPRSFVTARRKVTQKPRVFEMGKKEDGLSHRFEPLEAQREPVSIRVVLDAVRQMNGLTVQPP